MPTLTWSEYGPAVAPMTISLLSSAWAADSARARTDEASSRRRVSVMAEIRCREGKGAALVEAARQRVAAPLEELHQHDQNGDGEPHHVGLEAVVAVADGEVADAAAAHDAGHRRIRQEADRQH